jgi:hypothetical protein
MHSLRTSLARLAASVPLSFLAACALQPSPTPLTNAEAFASMLPAVIGRASAFEREILQDGIITAEENDHARETFIACLEERGVRVISVEVDENGLVQSMAYGSGDRADAATEQRIEGECRQEFYSLVEAGRFATVNADDSEAAYLARVSTCLRGRGHDVPPSPATFEEMLEGTSDSIMPDLRECAQASLGP